MIKLSEMRYYDTEHQTLYTYIPAEGEKKWDAQRVIVSKPEQPETGGLVVYEEEADALWAWATAQHLKSQ